jgi:hypothetical protein
VVDFAAFYKTFLHDLIARDGGPIMVSSDSGNGVIS